jgi:subtilisin family serine protease
MAIYNVLYSASTDVAALKAELAELGTIKLELPNARVISIDTTKAKLTGKPLTGVVLVEKDASLTVKPETSMWHLQRLITKELPLHITYKPKNHGEGVVVYVVDSGVNIAHSELDGASIEYLYTPDDYTDPSGHGTAIISLIVGKTVGVARGAHVKVVKIPMSTTISVSELLTALDAIIADHSGVAVVNCSWTVAKSSILDAKITELESDGLVVVAAAGNDGVAADTVSPAGLDSVLGVGASDVYDRVIGWGGVTPNFGPEVDVFAPGVDVMCATSGGLAEMSGTSLAAAVVSGVVAQFIADSPALSAAEIQALVVQETNDDLLFWDDAVYGDTPNKIVASPVAGSDVFGVEMNTEWNVRTGTSSVIGLTPKAPLVDWSYGEVHLTPTLVVKAWDWIVAEVMPTWLKLTVSPPDGLAPGYYTFCVKGHDSYGQEYVGRFRIGVFAEDPSELTPSSPEKYLTTSDTVVVTPAVCQSTDDCAKGKQCCNNACIPNTALC